MFITFVTQLPVIDNVGYGSGETNNEKLKSSPIGVDADNDKLSEEKDKTWNEFLRLIGICNTTYEKKERNIKDEVILSQAGTIASRYTRYNARIEAIDKINKMFNMNIEVGYYDGLPTSLDSEVSEDGEGNIQTTTNISSESSNS